MALGGVALGNMNAMLAAVTQGSRSAMGSRCSESASCDMMGRIALVRAALLVISDENEMNGISTHSTKI